jgi:hypothetical protein
MAQQPGYDISAFDARRRQGQLLAMLPKSVSRLGQQLGYVVQAA